MSIDGIVHLELPQFGGQGMLVEANDSVVAVDGCNILYLVIPFGHLGFSNAKSDKPDKQIAIQIIPSTTHELIMRIGVFDRKPREKDPKNLFQPVVGSLDSANITFKIDEEGRLTAVATPQIEIGRSKNTCLQLLTATTGNNAEAVV